MSRTQLPALFWGLTGALLLLPAARAQAQLAPDSARLALKVSVVRLLQSTYEAEVEYRYARRCSVVLLPRAVAGPASDYTPGNTRGNDRARGYGLGLSHRFYVPNTGTPHTGLAGLYLGLKGEYQHLVLSYSQVTWGEDVAADGLRYYTYRARDFTETISRVGGAATLGYQAQVFHPRLRLDCSVSLNTLRSRSSADEASRYRATRDDYAYSGTFWTLGLGLGFTLK